MGGNYLPFCFVKQFPSTGLLSYHAFQFSAITSWRADRGIQHSPIPMTKSAKAGQLHVMLIPTPSSETTAVGRPCPQPIAEGRFRPKPALWLAQPDVCRAAKVYLGSCWAKANNRPQAAIKSIHENVWHALQSGLSLPIFAAMKKKICYPLLYVSCRCSRHSTTHML